MGLFPLPGKKDGGGGIMSWGKMIQEAKAVQTVQQRMMNDLQNIYYDNKNSGAHMVWKHLRDQSVKKMESQTKNKNIHQLYVQRALKKAAQNDNFTRENSFISTSTRDQVLLMYRAAQKNKTKAGQMIHTKDATQNVTYYPGMLAEGKEDIETATMCLEDHIDDLLEADPALPPGFSSLDKPGSGCSSGSSTLAYQKIKNVEPLAESSRNVSRTSVSWQPLSMNALEEYSPQIKVNSKSTEQKEKLWKVV